MSQLSDLPNLGPTVIAELARVGITTPAQLKRAGSVGAAVKLVQAGIDVCTSKLSGLEGAIRGVRWHSIPADERAELRRRFEERRGTR
jgi:DNA transformation protein and related proteins